LVHQWLQQHRVGRQSVIINGIFFMQAHAARDVWVLLLCDTAAGCTQTPKAHIHVVVTLAPGGSQQHVNARQKDLAKRI
jgi:hypothetical protein